MIRQYGLLGHQDQVEVLLNIVRSKVSSKRSDVLGKRKDMIGLVIRHFKALTSYLPYQSFKEQ